MPGKSFESRLFARLPEILLAGVVPPFVLALTARDPMTVFLALGFMTAWSLAAMQLALGCWFIRVMKGPRRRADGHRLPDGRL